ncbi:hypothetical protein B0T18DRAFT_440424 [Schizothecium vesticola]|uniref:Carboxylesterase family protein n=1 Tax=Schizothecium vesticola TaxID=314040 RepID=A0AA40EKI8_9PEZI|nr:hypothetical protein B0T18DRAFT_440424 [Schizothecium vesticola]
MSSATRSRQSSEVDIYDDNTYYAHSTIVHHQYRPDPLPHSVLGDLPPGHIQNNIKSSVDSLTSDLGRLHIRSNSTKENTFEQEQIAKTRGRKARPQVEFSTFQVPISTQEEVEEPASCGSVVSDSGAVASYDLPKSENPHPKYILSAAVRELPSNPEQLLKHQAGQFEWVLSIPATVDHDSDSAKGGRPRSSTPSEDHGSPHRGEKRLLFGCNLVHRKPRQDQSGGDGPDTAADSIYTILATRIEGDEDTDSASTTAAADELMDTMSTDTTVIKVDSPHADGRGPGRRSEFCLLSKSDGIPEQLLAPPLANPVSRIEDSVEALDKLEEELEALNEVTRLNRALSSKESKGMAANTGGIGSSSNRTASMVRNTGANTARVRRSTDRSSATRRSVSTSYGPEEEKRPAVDKAVARRSLVARPMSLLPPKPPAKSTKAPTMSTFELPGEAVARRLREQREARLSRHISPEQAAATAAAYSPSKPHFKSMKQPTRPTFELPGEAISRRKREEREARLRAQEEEERKRREFKARPIRSSLAPNSLPRETLASRARQGRASGQSESGTSIATPGSAARARQSLTMPASSRVSLSRGRSELMVDQYPAAAGTSRATSTSTGSVRGGAGPGSVASVSKRSTVSTEDQQQQKTRARQIFVRDNGISAERDRGKRERENATKLARQEAAERSRFLSREWAEKQKREREKRKSMIGSS